MLAQSADRVFEVDFFPVQGDVKLVFQLVGKGPGCDGAEHFAIVARFYFDQAGELGNAFGELTHGIELMGLALRAALAQGFDAPFVSARQRYGKSLREEIIAGVAGGHLYVVRLSAEADNIVSEDNFGF